MSDTGETSVSGAPTLQDFLRIVAEKGGTDLHITAESPPVMRLNGELRPLPFPPLSSTDTKHLCYSVLTETQKHRFEEQQELDFSFGIRGLSRFRGNLFVQRGAVGGAFRTIPYSARPLAELGLPPVVAELTRAAARPRAGDRADRQREVDHVGGDDRQDQPRAPRAHHDARGSRSSSSTRTATASSISARSTPTRTASTKRCATCCARIRTSC